MVCAAALHRIHDLRHWVYLWRLVDISAFVFAQYGQLHEAALVVGHLDAHVPGWLPEPRSSTKAILAGEGRYDQSFQEGAAMDRDTLARRVIHVADKLEVDRS
jgi:hypothetical protein